jgi:serine/threonine-protein kinase
MELIGRQFGHIRVTDVVGEGGMGAVYAGHDTKLDRKVALKVLHAEQRLDEEARERLLREARALSKIDHPNICRIHDYIETGPVDLLVLEYIDGRTLQKAIEEGLTHAEKLRIALAVAEVLVCAHRAGIVHRDLKPENVMLTSAGEVKVLDFGLARWFHTRKSSAHGSGGGAKLRVKDDEHVDATLAMPAARHSDVSPSGRREFLATAAGITLGTPLYMSPEQARGENLTPASDLFAFGLLLQVLFTGKEPHPEVMSAREIILRVARGETNPIEGAPAAITSLVNSLKQFAPTDRPTAVETVDRLKFLIATPQRVVRRSIAAAVVFVLLAGTWKYVVDLGRERSIAVAARAEAERQRAKAEDMIEFMLGDLRKKLEPVGRLEVLDDAAQRALRYVDEIDPSRSGASELARNSKALNQLVEVRIAQGKLQEALDLADRSHRLTYLALQKAKSDPEVQLAHGISRYWLGHVYRLRGDHESALAHWKGYSAITERLAREHPDNENYQLERAYGYSNLASLLEDVGDLDAALRQHLLVLEVKTALLAKAPGDVKRRTDLAIAINKMAVVQHRLGRYAEARRAFEREGSTYEQLLATDPANQTWKDRLSRSYSYLARTLEAVGQLDAAEERVRKSFALQSAMHQLDPSNTRWTRNLAMTHNDLAMILYGRGHYGEAISQAGTARDLMSELITQDPQRGAWILERASVRVSLARALVREKRIADAERELAESRRDVEAASPNAGAAVTLACVDFATGELYAARGNPTGARKAWSDAADAFAKVSKGDLATRLHVIALLRLDRLADAAPIIDRFERSGYRHPEYLAERVASSGRVQIAESARR